jgi:hypothetical protein
MPVPMQVNFTPGEFHARETEDDRCTVAHMINELPGFLWKIWISHKPSNTRGGIYLFDDLKAAKAFGDDVLAAKLAEGGANNVSIRYFDIDEAPSQINRAHLHIGAAQTA